MGLRKRDNAISRNLQEQEPAPSENVQTFKNPSSYFQHHPQIAHTRESSRNDVIDIVTRLKAGPSGARILAGVKICLFFVNSRQVAGPTHHRTHW
jgi:hypothetical protein